MTNRSRGTAIAWAPRAALGLLTLVAGWAFAHLFASEPGGLDTSAHLAEIARLAQAMRAGDWSWWNPSANAGYASGYYYQVLPQAVPAAFSALTGLAPLTAYQLAIFLPLIFSPAAAYHALRVMGADRVSALGAAVAVPFCVGGQLVMGPNMDAARWGQGADGAILGGLYTQLWAFVAFPPALAYASRWVGEGRGLAAAIATSVFVTLCHPFAGLALGVAVSSAASWFMALRRLRKQRGEWAPVARLVALGALMVLGSACAWVPTLVDYAGFGGFPHRMADEIGPGFQRLLGWLARGHLLDHGRLPALTVLLPIVLFVARAAWLPPLWTAAVSYVFILGAGPHLGKTEDDLLPVVRFLGAMQIVLAMAIGSGAVIAARRLSARVGGAKVGMRTSVAMLLVAVFAIVAWGGATTQRGRVKGLADYGFVDRPDFLRMVETLKTLPAGRLQVRYGAECHWTISLPDVYAARPAALVFGGAAVQSSPNFAYLWALGAGDPARTAWVFDAPLLLVRRNHLHRVPGGEVIADGTTYQLRAYPSPGLVSPVRIVGQLPAGRMGARAAVLRWLAGEHPMRGEVLVYAGSAAGADTTRIPAPARTLSTARGSSSIHAEVEADAASTFVVRESWHPRWRATLDSASAPIRRVTPDFMAFDVPAGHHALALRFERPAWVWLLWLLWPGLTLAAWAWDRRRAIAAPDQALGRVRAAS